jgi:hypothetical protein
MKNSRFPVFIVPSRSLRRFTHVKHFLAAHPQKLPRGDDVFSEKTGKMVDSGIAVAENSLLSSLS